MVELSSENMASLYKSLIAKFCNSLWPFVDSQRHIFSIQLDITNACNLSCTHCYHGHHKNSGALSFTEWVEILDQYEHLVRKLCMIPRMTICGGEPLVCSYLFPMLENIRSRFDDCELNILTNGTLVTSESASLFRTYNARLQVSFDGPDAERNDLIRGKGSFEKAIRGSRHLVENNVPFHHLAVLSHRTAQWIPDFFYLLPRQTGANAMNFVRLIAEGHAKLLQQCGHDHPLEGVKLKEAMELILACSKNTGVPTATSGPLWHLIDSSLGSPNNIGMSGLVVGYKGEFKVSSRTSITLGNILREGMEKIFFTDPIMEKLRTGDIEGCGDCIDFKRCRGERNASFAAYGHFFGRDPGCWR